jgi:hypothetical protein
MVLQESASILPLVARAVVNLPSAFVPMTPTTSGAAPKHPVARVVTAAGLASAPVVTLFQVCLSSYMYVHQSLNNIDRALPWPDRLHVLSIWLELCCKGSQHCYDQSHKTIRGICTQTRS